MSVGHQIIKQPNGLYAVWSSIVDDFVLLDATTKEIVKMFVDDARERIQEEVEKKVKILEDGGKPYYQFTQTWEEACQWASQVHGKRWKPPKISAGKR